MNFRHTAAFVLAAGLVASSAAADVRLSIHDGHVSLSATNATVSQILAEWAKVGRTKVVNGERASSPPMALELANVPEAEALRIILRSVSGYLLAPRAAAAPDASTYDRILIVPATRAVSAAPPPTSAQDRQPSPAGATFAQQLFGQMQRNEENGGNNTVNNGGAEPPTGRPALFNFPQAPANGGGQPPQQNPAPAAPSAAPVVPAGMQFPGMLPPPPPPQNRQDDQNRQR